LFDRGVINNRSDCLLVISEDLDDRLEGEPFGDVLSSSEHLSELGSGQFLEIEVLFLGFVGGDVSLGFGVDKVQGRNGCDSELFTVGLGNVLGFVGTVVIISGDGGLGSGHVTSDDEMGASEILADHHVLDGLTGSGHVHGVRKVFPEHAVVLGFFLKDLVGLVSDDSRDIIGLGRSAGRVDEDDSVLSDEGIVEGTGEKLVVSSVDRVTALEGDDVLVVREPGADLGGVLQGKSRVGRLSPVTFPPM